MSKLLEMQKGFSIDYITCAELHRELGQFEQGGRVLQERPNEKKTIILRLMGQLILGKITAPVRYRV
jgi:hypothetical protein